MLEAGLPDGVVNVVTGFGAEAGAALCTDRRLRKLDLTGGTETGRVVAKLAGENLIRVTCELGGKAPVIVLPDADLDRAAAGATFAAFIASGQTCVAGTRVLVHESQAAALVERMVRRARAIRLGDPLDLATQLGPLVSAAQLERTERYVEIGRAEGANVACGGRRPGAELASGFFYEPTIFTNVANTMRIAREEVFGPILSIIPFADEDEALAIANDSPYGLAAGVWTSDIGRAIRMSEKIEAGTVWVNCYRAVSYMAPFGGYKRSGIGRESGQEAIDAYLQTKSVWIDTSGQTANPFVLR